MISQALAMIRCQLREFFDVAPKAVPLGIVFAMITHNHPWYAVIPMTFLLGAIAALADREWRYRMGMDQ